MKTVDILPFEVALKTSSSEKKRRLLLSNGFSRACSNEIFSYGNLLDQAIFKGLSKWAKGCFDVLKTTNFEVVMDALKNASDLVSHYYPRNSSMAKQFKKDAEGLKEVLVSTIAGRHPESPFSVSDAKYQSCKRFLSGFQDIYTVNYDLLLYWALMRDEIQPMIKCDDGFRQLEGGPQPWVTWDSSAHDQNVFYLHGALHVYEAGPEIQKFTWMNTKIRLIEQIRESLNKDKYPLFVAEGTSEQKMEKINKSSFLGRCYRSFQNIGNCLFIYGVSFGESDSHILKAIVKSKVSNVFVSIFGDPKNDENKKIIKSALSLVEGRGVRRKGDSLKVSFFDASSAKVWG